MQLEAADQTTLTTLREYDDGVPLDKLSLPDRPVSMPLDDASRRKLAHAYRLIRHKYGKGSICNIKVVSHLTYFTDDFAAILPMSTKDE